MRRNPETGKWECETTQKACGDGLYPGIERSLLADFKQKECKDADAEDEDIKCQNDEKQKRDPTTAEWGCEDGDDPKACGDGLYPGIDRAKLLSEVPVACNDENGDDQAIECANGDPQIRNPETAEWKCYDDEEPKVCGDGLLPGIERSKLLSEIPDVCKNPEGADEEIECDSGNAQVRNKETAKWYCEDD
jgi:hypothetical protein